MLSTPSRRHFFLPPPSPNWIRSQGREVTKLYGANCAGCHGADLSGGSSPSLAAACGGTAETTPASLAASATATPKPACPRCDPNLNDAEIRRRVIYIHERSAAFERDHTKYNAPPPGAIVQTERESFKLESFVDSGLEEPWDIAFLPDGRMLVTERPGRLRIIDHGRLLPEPVLGMPSVFGDEGGLLDVVPHPRYAAPGNDWIYLSYGDEGPDGQAMTIIIRGRLRNGAFVDSQQILKADSSSY